MEKKNESYKNRNIKFIQKILLTKQDIPKKTVYIFFLNNWVSDLLPIKYFINFVLDNVIVEYKITL